LLTVEIREKLEGMSPADQEGLRDFNGKGNGTVFACLGERRGGRFFCLFVGLFMVLLSLFSLVRSVTFLS
jgi:hypothetical protein